MFFCLTLLLLNSCGEAAYYYQAVRGQLSLLAKRKQISKVIASPDTPTEIKKRLELLERIRIFAVQRLLLPDNGSFTTLVNVKTKNVVWNVYAAPELSVTPEKWCFPVAGCVNYRGYFTQKAARLYGGRYREKGFDVYIGPSAAFSTLGWFEDPVYSTFLHWPEASLAGLIFHELAHARIYVKGDSSFNESFAMAVENEGVRRWLEREGRPAEFNLFLERRKHNEEFVDLMLKTRNSLDKVYRSTASDSEKRGRKEHILKLAKRRYTSIKAVWGNDRRWDGWVKKDLNNAKLASIATYNRYVPAFSHLLNTMNNDMEEFYKAVRTMADLPKESRKDELTALLNSSRGL